MQCENRANNSYKIWNMYCIIKVSWFIIVFGRINGNVLNKRQFYPYIIFSYQIHAILFEWFKEENSRWKFKLRKSFRHILIIQKVLSFVVEAFVYGVICGSYIYRWGDVFINMVTLHHFSRCSNTYARVPTLFDWNEFDVHAVLLIEITDN